MGNVTPMMPSAVWAALERLLEVARADTHQARYVANFLLAWWNAGDLGGFDLTEAWGLDEALREDLVTLFGFVARNRSIPAPSASGLNSRTWFASGDPRCFPTKPDERRRSRPTYGERVGLPIAVAAVRAPVWGRSSSRPETASPTPRGRYG